MTSSTQRTRIDEKIPRGSFPGGFVISIRAVSYTHLDVYKRQDQEALDRAQDMERRGVAMETIFQETGWYTGADGKWQMCIRDSPRIMSMISAD